MGSNTPGVPGLRAHLGLEEWRPGPAYHAVLCVQQVGVHVVPLEERPVQPQILQLLILDHRPQLLVVPKKNHLEGQAGTVPTPTDLERPAPPPRRCPPRDTGLARTAQLLTFSACEKVTRGMRVSGSVAMPASSMRICRTASFLRLLEAAHEHVHRTTLCCSSSNFRAFPRTSLYLHEDAIRSHRDPPPPATYIHGPSCLPGEVVLGKDLPFLQPGIEFPDVRCIGVGGLPDPVVQGDAPGMGGTSIKPHVTPRPRQDCGASCLHPQTDSREITPEGLVGPPLPRGLLGQAAAAHTRHREFRGLGLLAVHAQRLQLCSPAQQQSWWQWGMSDFPWGRHPWAKPPHNQPSAPARTSTDLLEGPQYKM